MKNLKRIVFGILAMLVMVTSVDAAEYNVVGPNGNDLRTCLADTLHDYTVCKLSGDIEITSSSSNIEVNREVTIDLNGHKMTLSGGAAIEVTANGKLTLTNGEVIQAATGHYGIIVDGELETSKLTLTANTSWAAINVSGANAAVKTSTDTIVKATSGAVIVRGTNANVTLNADIEAGSYALSVEASAAKATVAVEDGKLVSKNAEAVVANAGTVVFNGGEVTGKTNALKVINADVTVPESSYTSFKSTTAEVVNYNPNSATTAKLNLNGGQYESEEGYAVVVNLSSGTGAEINLTGGYYAAGKHGHSIVGTQASHFVTGGSFNVEPYDYTVANHHKAVKYGDTWYITKEYNINIRMTEHGTVTDPLGTAINVAKAYGMEEVKLDDIIKATPDEGYHAVYVVTKADGTEVTLKNEVTTVDGEETNRIVSFEMPEEDVTLTVYFVKDGEELNPDTPTVDPAPVDPTPVDPSGDGEETPGSSEQTPADQNPSETTPADQNPSETTPAGDENNSENPSTLDSIVSIVTLAISSLGTAGYSIKKFIRK